MRRCMLPWLIGGLFSLCTPTWASMSFCGKVTQRSAAQDDRLLQLSTEIRRELVANNAPVALVARSGLNLGRFGLRYSHAGWALRDSPDIPWSVRQLYYDCDEQRSRLFDQGLSGFVQGVDDPDHSQMAVVLLPDDAATTVAAVVRDKVTALSVLQGPYSANAYAWSTRYQNCNQWAVEILATALAAPRQRAAPRTQAQDWLRSQGYQPSRVPVGLWWGLSAMSPWLHNDDHPAQDPQAPQYEVSTPDSLAAFIRLRWPEARRIEWCLTSQHWVRHEGWTPLDAQCTPQAGDAVTRVWSVDQGAKPVGQGG